MIKKSKALAPTSRETKAITTMIGCIDFIPQTAAYQCWIHVYDAAVAALKEKLC